ncbi:DUF6603 domain-containing protein [Sorangium sp. So ce426]|uniref:DUF6603 domain-containing protein n=1 Tax=Sorangium sp. So ce426 TaxID=3133312 RepID=UPI003F5C0467
MPLDTLQSQLEKLAASGDLTVSSVAGLLPAIAAMMDSLPPISLAPLTNATFALSPAGPDQTLTLRATLDWGLFKGIHVVITAAVDATSSNRFLATLDITAPPATTLSIPGLDWFALAALHVRGTSQSYALWSTGLAVPATISVGATLTIKNVPTTFPIVIGEDSTGLLQLTLDTSAVELPSINNVLAAFGDAASAIRLPSTLDELAHFSLLELGVGFDPSTGTLAQISAKVGNSTQQVGGWQILPGVLALESYAVGLTIADPLHTRRVGGLIAATARLGKVDIAVAAQHPAAGGWQFSGEIGAENPVPIGDILTGLAGQFGVALPNVLHEFVLKDFVFSFDSATYDALGQLTVDFTVGATPVEMTVGASLVRSDNAYKPTVRGQLLVGSATFDIAFDGQSAAKTFTAKWSDPTTPLQFGDIAALIGWSDFPPLPEGLDLALTSAEFTYDFNGGKIAFSAASKNFGRVLFATLNGAAGGPSADARIYFFALDVPLNLDFRDLPFAGELLPADVEIGVKELQIVAVSAALGAPDLVAVAALLRDRLDGAALIPTALTAGLTFAARMNLGSPTPQPVVVALTNKPAAPRSLAAAPAAAQPAYQVGATWFAVDRTLGPIKLDRIGLQYQGDTLFFLFDASASLSALSFSLQGLGIGSPLTRFAPTGHLDGLAVAFNSGPLTIDGGLLVVPEAQLPSGVRSEYVGELTVAFAPWLIGAAAAYATLTSGTSSFFVFAQVIGAFGGPPAFFVTGFMGGFGYNSQLRLPAVDQVYRFPFVAGLDDPAVFGPAPTPLGVLSTLAGGSQAWVTPSAGRNWIAAGIRFRSFELILGRALLVVDFGDDFEVALLGLASTSFPQGATTDAYAFVELQLAAVFKPDDGYFGVSASLTPACFVISRDCHLTGGFAFCLWSGDSPHAGDFVFTVGGYHPAFVPPPWYPVPARVGFNWQVDGSTTMKGGAYFALTPSAIMAGGDLEALYQSGQVRAWFKAYANLMITWKPFHFLADIGVSVGASVRVDLLFTTVTLSFELGASLTVWGPPTGGTVRVYLSILSFTIDFGASEASGEPKPLAWHDFQTLLPSGPAPTVLAAAADSTEPASVPAVLGLQINRGLSHQGPAGTWIVRADELIFTAHTAVPATAIDFGSKGAPPLASGAKPVVPPATISIRPMAVSGATSGLRVTLTRIDDGAELGFADWTQIPEAAALPEAMWGAPLARGATPPATAATIPRLPVGVQLIAPPAVVGESPGPMKIDELLDPLGTGAQPLTPATQADPLPSPVVDPTTIRAVITSAASAAAVATQQSMLAALADLGAAPPTRTPLTELAKQAGKLFSQPPLRAA